MKTYSILCVLLTCGCGSPRFDGADAAALDADESCPLFTAGDNVVMAHGVERQFVTTLPSTWSPSQTWPLVFAWHGSGGDPRIVIDSFGLVEHAETDGLISIASRPRDPDALPLWDDLSAPADNLDLALYDRLLACAQLRLHVDPQRVYSAGMSGGAFFSYWLAMVRADTLAAIAPFSGSLRPAWQPPAAQPAALVTWGGSTDQSLGASPTGDVQVWSYDIEARVQIDRLRANGQFVVACDHGGGHHVPPEARTYLTPFLLAHRRDQPSALAGGLGAAFPSYCAIAP